MHDDIPCPTESDCAALADQIVREATALAAQEPLLRSFLRRRIGETMDLATILSRVLAAEFEQPEMAYRVMLHLFRTTFSQCPGLTELATADVNAVTRRDPAADSPLAVLLDHKGFQALLAHRIAHALWGSGRVALARRIQSISARRLAVDIHPACHIGYAVMLDHATGIVIGETTKIGNNVSIMQAVTLGGTGKETGDRHPKIGDGVLIGAGAILLGNIKVGDNARIGAGSVVLEHVPPNATAVGVPATSSARNSTEWCATEPPAESMDHTYPR